MNADKVAELEEKIRKALYDFQRNAHKPDVVLSNKNCASCGHMLPGLNEEKPEAKHWNYFPKKDEHTKLLRKTMQGKGYSRSLISTSEERKPEDESIVKGNVSVSFINSEIIGSDLQYQNNTLQGNGYRFKSPRVFSNNLGKKQSNVESCPNLLSPLESGLDYYSDLDKDKLN